MQVQEYHIAISIEMFSSHHNHNNIVCWAKSVRKGVENFSPDVMKFCGHVADYMLSHNPLEVEVLRSIYRNCTKDQYDMDRVLRLADEKMSGTVYVFTHPPAENTYVISLATSIHEMSEIYGEHGRYFCEYLAKYIQQPDPAIVLRMHRYYSLEYDKVKLDELIRHTVQEIKKLSNRVHTVQAHLADVVIRS